MAFQKAVKEQSKLRLALCSLAGYGKTFTALSIATAIAAMMRELQQGDGRVCLIDTEHGSASKYGRRFDFDTDVLESYSPLAYVDKIHEAERAGYDIIIVDSLSQAWYGKGGALEQKDNAAARGGNSWTAWREITPKHNELVETMLGCHGHLIATLRVKMEYVQNTVNGKTTIEKVGLAAIQREGMEYEFDLVGDLDQTHSLRITKTRFDGVIDIGDLFEKPGQNVARKIYGWLMDGVAPVARPVVMPVESQPTVDSRITGTLSRIRNAESLEALSNLMPELKEFNGTALLKDVRKSYNERKAWLERQLLEQSRQPEPTATAAEEREYIDSKQPEEMARRAAPPAPEAA